MKGSAKIAFLAALTLSVVADMPAQMAPAQPQDRVVSPIDNSVMVPLQTSVHPAVARATSSSPVEPGFAMNHMILLLMPTAIQQAGLTQLLALQQDPLSPSFHKFLTPDQFAAQFGASVNDVGKVTAWLAGNGFQVEEVSPNKLSIVFSGNAAQVHSAFGTEMQRYVIDGETHYANSSAIQIPAALSTVVGGLAKLNDFHSKPNMSTLKTLTQVGLVSDTTSGSSHYLAPADYAIIYNLNPLFAAAVNGVGQSVAVIGRSNVLRSDIATFRSQYGLPIGIPSVLLANGTDPGFTADADALEATLDIEWAGAVAPKAVIKLVTAASTSTADGVDLAILYAVNQAVAPVISVSYSTCEASANNSFYDGLWRQAAAQGISVFVAAGDSGAAGCQGSNAIIGSGAAVNGLCSSSYATCVGGTEFNEGNNPGQYWLPGNNPAMGSAISYIPEKVWNESGAVQGGSNLFAGGGGASSVYAKPAWQTGLGVPADGKRDVPDVSLAAANHDGYELFYNGAQSVVSGTSASTPSMAGMMAMVLQRYGPQGSANPGLYAIAARQQSGGTAVFHDIVAGDNSVPGVAGFSATAGYDLASGLGSVDGAALANNWINLPKTFSLSISSTSVSVTPTQSGSVILTLAPSNDFSSKVSLSFSNLPGGVGGTFSAPTLVGATGSSTLTFAVDGNAQTGAYPVVITAVGGGVTKTVTLTLNVTVVTGCTLAASPSGLTIQQGQGSSVSISCLNAQGAFSSALSLSLTGLPSGVTAAFSSISLTPGTGASKLTLFSSSSAAAGTYPLTVTAILPGASPAFVRTVSVPFTVSAPAIFTLTPSPSSVSFMQGGGASFTVTSVHTGSFNRAINFSVSGLPAGITTTLSATQINAPGDGVITITLQSVIGVAARTYSAVITGESAGIVDFLPVAVNVTVAPTFTMTSGQTTLSVRRGATASMSVTVSALTGGFNAAIVFGVIGLPAGVTASFEPASLPAPGAGSSVLSLTASNTATTGVIMIGLSATGLSLVRTVPLQLTVLPAPSFSLTASLPSYNIAAGDTVKELITATGFSGYNSPINLSTSILPTGVTVSFSSLSISGLNGSSTISVQTAATMTPGTYSIVVIGTDPVTAVAQSAIINLLVGTVTTTISPNIVNVSRNGVGSAAVITVAGLSYTGNVSLYLTTLPVGVTYALSAPVLPGSGTSTLTIYANGSATTGPHPVNVHAAMGGVFTLTPLSIVVTN